MRNPQGVSVAETHLAFCKNSFCDVRLVLEVAKAKRDVHGKSEEGGVQERWLDVCGDEGFDESWNVTWVLCPSKSVS